MHTIPYVANYIHVTNINSNAYVLNLQLDDIKTFSILKNGIGIEC